MTNIGAGIITLQETQFWRNGRLSDKLPEFEIFEDIRKKQKGGTLIALHKGLDPVLIEELSEVFELLVVEVSMGDKEVRSSQDMDLRRTGEWTKKCHSSGHLKVK